jgi:hypothetical protein
MKKQEVILNEVKEVLIKAMISRFEKEGYLDPMIIFLRNDLCDVMHVPSEMFSCDYLKQQLVDTIKQRCQDPSIIAVCIIYETYMVLFGQQEQELSNLIAKGIKRVSDCEQKKDAIMMFFCTPVEEEVISYFVDCENKRVINENPLRSKNVFGGVFHNLFGNVA